MLKEASTGSNKRCDLIQRRASQLYLPSFLRARPFLIMQPVPRKHNPLFSAVFLLPSIAAAINLNCESIVDDGVHFNFKPLGGVHSLSFISGHHPAKFYNNVTLDICAPLKKPEGVDTCHSGTRGKDFL